MNAPYVLGISGLYHDSAAALVHGGHVIAAAHDLHPTQQRDLALVLRQHSDGEFTMVALGGLVDRLEAVELVERRSDAKDRRVKRIFLTPAGGKVVNKMRSISEPTNAEILAGIAPALRARAIRVITALRATA